jgi:hypothetical protein
MQRRADPTDFWRWTSARCLRRHRGRSAAISPCCPTVDPARIRGSPTALPRRSGSTGGCLRRGAALRVSTGRSDGRAIAGSIQRGVVLAASSAARSIPRGYVHHEDRVVLSRRRPAILLLQIGRMGRPASIDCRDEHERASARGRRRGHAAHACARGRERPTAERRPRLSVRVEVTSSCATRTGASPTAGGPCWPEDLAWLERHPEPDALPPDSRRPRALPLEMSRQMGGARPRRPEPELSATATSWQYAAPRRRLHEKFRTLGALVRRPEPEEERI